MPIQTHSSAFADGAAYEETLGPSHRYYIRVKADLLKAIVRKIKPHRLDVLDLGCGTGEMAEALDEPQWNITGMDLSPEMIGHAVKKEIPRATFLAGDASDTGLAAESFDLVYATALMHHVPPPLWPKVVDEMKRLLRPGGILAIFEHNTHNPLTRRVVATCPVDKDAVLLSPKTTFLLVKNAELAVVKKQYLLFIPFFARSLRRADSLFRKLPIGGQYVVVARKPASDNPTHGVAA